MLRLQKYIAKAGITSRRKAEKLIEEGRVKVNGKIVKEMGIKIDPKQDEVLVDNKKAELEDKKVYILLNKPEGYVTTLSDQFGRPTVVDLIKGVKERIYPVGRLDYDTSGLLLLTNDGNLTNKITHPSNHIDKTYISKIKGRITEEELNKFRKGLDIGDYVTAPAHIEILEKFNRSTLVKIIIHEGKNRQIRRMMDTINHPVIKLKRVSIGKINLQDMSKGNWRYLSMDEIRYLKTL